MRYRNAALSAFASVVLVLLAPAEASESSTAGDNPERIAMRQADLSGVQDAKPDDFLPDAYLEQKHTDMCALPDTERRELLDAFDEPPGNETVSAGTACRRLAALAVVGALTAGRREAFQRSADCHEPQALRIEQWLLRV